MTATDIGNRTGSEHLREPGAAPGSLGPMGGGISQMIRDEPAFARLPLHALQVMAWACRYTEETPTRDDIKRCMYALTSGRRIDN